MRATGTARNPRSEINSDRMIESDLQIQRIVLLGFMCSGKSTVGQSLARRLGWRFVDFDAEIERREGRPVGVIVDNKGEDYLRSLEVDLTQETSLEGEIVLAPGGGWITNPALLEMIRPGTLAVWLRVSPRETLRRLRDDNLPRPLRDHPDALGQIADLLQNREPLYRLADISVPTDGRPVEVIAFELEQVVRTRNLSVF